MYYTRVNYSNSHQKKPCSQRSMSLTSNTISTGASGFKVCVPLCPFVFGPESPQLLVSEGPHVSMSDAEASGSRHARASIPHPKKTTWITDDVSNARQKLTLRPAEWRSFQIPWAFQWSLGSTSRSGICINPDSEASVGGKTEETSNH